MGGEDIEAVAGGESDFDVEDTPGGSIAAVIDEESFIGVGAALGDGESAQEGDLDIGIVSIDDFGVGQFEAQLVEAVLDICEGGGAADFLQGDDIGLGEGDGLAGGGAGGWCFCGAGGGFFEDVVFEVIGGDAQVWDVCGVQCMESEAQDGEV